jgi:hypothetical protein
VIIFYPCLQVDRAKATLAVDPGWVVSTESESGRERPPADTGPAGIILLVDYAVQTGVTMQACVEVLQTAMGNCKVPIMCLALTSPSGGHRWPLPSPVPTDAGVLRAISESKSCDAWESMLVSLGAQPTICALDPTQSCAALLLSRLLPSDLEQIRTTALPQARLFLGHGSSAPVSDAAGVYLRYRTFHGPVGSSSRSVPALATSLEAIAALRLENPGLPLRTSYVGKGVNVGKCWADADGPSGGGRSLPRPFQDIHGPLVSHVDLSCVPFCTSSLLST